MQRLLMNPRKRGETLLEVLIAIVILTGVFAGIFGLLLRASATNTNVVNRVVALNIAREGIEGVRNIRDTNWLKYSGDRRNKWLCLDTEGTPDACENGASTLIDSGIYTIEFVDTRYFLTLQEDLSGETSEQVRKRMRKGKDEESGLAETYRLYEDGEGRFSHEDVGDVLPFYRQLYLIPENVFVDPVSCKIEGCPKNVRLRVLSRVQWTEEENVRTVDLEAFLYDFLGRESY